MYQSVEPYDSGHLDVGDGHAVYWDAGEQFTAAIDAMADQRRHAGPTALSAGWRSSVRFCVSWPSVIMRTNAADMAVQLAEERNEQHRPDDDRRTSRSARSA